MLEKHSVSIKGHQTSITLEPEFWAELKNIAKTEHKSVEEIVSLIDEENSNANLSSCIRIFVLKKVKSSLG